MRRSSIEKALKHCYSGMLSSRRGSKLYRHIYAAACSLERAAACSRGRAAGAKKKGARK